MLLAFVGSNTSGMMKLWKDEANARLIAAAPDLLACLQETVEAAAALMRAIHASGRIDEVIDELEPGYDGFGVRARAAGIAKATCKPPADFLGIMMELHGKTPGPVCTCGSCVF